jgi:hypothetical protein
VRTGSHEEDASSQRLTERDILDARLQAVADPGLRDEKPRTIGIRLDDLPQVADENAQILDVLSDAAAPDIVNQLIVGDLFIVWQVVNLIVFRSPPGMPVLFGGVLIVFGGLIVTFWK